MEQKPCVMVGSEFWPLSNALGLGGFGGPCSAGAVPVLCRIFGVGRDLWWTSGPTLLQWSLWISEDEFKRVKC